MNSIFVKRLRASSVVLLVLPVWALAEPVGTVVVARGKSVRKSGSVSTPVRVGDKVQAGDVLATGADGGVKVLMPDQSDLSLGPNTTIRTERAAGQGTTGSVSVIKGQFRAKVVKDLLKSGEDKGTKIRMLVRTKSATMGVRGTDFSVIYNADNQVTSLVTYEGGVALVKNAADQAPTSLSAVSDALASDQAVVVAAGQFSTAAPAMELATVPTKISPAQFEALKSADIAGVAGAPGQGAAPPPKSIGLIPPGVDAKAFIGTGAGLEKQLENTLGKDVVAAAVPDAPGAGQTPPPEGFYDKGTGKFAPPAGGFIDFRTGLYVPPPPGSAFDPNTGVYVPPPAMGGFDPKSGGYLPPQGFNLDPSKGFVPVGAPGDKGPPPPPGSPPPGGMPGFFPGLPGQMPGMGPGGYPGAFPGMPGFFPVGPPPPGGLPEDYQPLYPINDPYCPNCAPPLPPSGTTNTQTTTLQFVFTVN